MAFSPNGKFVYVTNDAIDNIEDEAFQVSVIDTFTNTITANITVGDWPQYVAFSPDGKSA